jgi:acylphosphatase
MRKCVKVTVKGTVHGVGYRHFIQKKAKKLELEGSIQNREDGSVLAFICGPLDKIDDLIDFIYEGSPKAKVEDVVVEPLSPDKDFRGIFRVIGENN